MKQKKKKTLETSQTCQRPPWSGLLRIFLVHIWQTKLCMTRSNLREANHQNPQHIIITMKSKVLLLLWLSLHCWPECFLLGCSRGLGLWFGFRSRLFSFGLQGFKAQDLTVPVALVQSFKLVNEGGGTVPFEAFISKKKKKKKLLIHKSTCVNNLHL